MPMVLCRVHRTGTHVQYYNGRFPKANFKILFFLSAFVLDSTYVMTPPPPPIEVPYGPITRIDIVPIFTGDTAIIR
jgi:hypothetical protein